MDKFIHRIFTYCINIWRTKNGIVSITVNRWEVSTWNSCEELGTSLACASSPEQGIDVSSKSWSYLTKTLKIFVFLHFQIRSNRWQNSKTILIMANCHSLKSSTIPLGKLLGKYWVFQLPSLLTTWATF